MKPTALVLAFALALASGCGGKQLTNRQVVIGAVSVAAIVLIVLLLSTECDNDNGNDCNFQ